MQYLGLSRLVFGLALNTKPLKTQSSTSSSRADDIPISSCVSEVLVKKISFICALYNDISLQFTSTFPNKSFCNEIIQFRLAIDTIAVRLFIKNATDEEINELENIHNKMIASKNDFENFFECDADFHKFIVKGSKNSILYRTTEILFNIMKYNSLEEYNRINPEIRIQEHFQILNAIKERDSKIALIYMERHLKRSIPDLEEV